MLQIVRDELSTDGRHPGGTAPKQLQWWSWRGLTSQFTVVALGILVNGMTLLGIWTASQIEKGVIEHSVANAALHLDSFIEPHVQSLADGLPLADSATAALQNLSRHVEENDHIHGVRIWSRELRPIWSDVADMPVDAVAAAGRLWVDGQPDTAHIFTEHVTPKGEIESRLHIFAPMHKTGTDRVIAVAELIETARVLKARVDRSRFQTALVFMLLTIAMFIPLVLIVRRGSRTISDQGLALSERVLELGDHVRRISQLKESLVDAQSRSGVVREKTLRRIGADLHDGPIQCLAIALLKLEGLRPAGDAATSPQAAEYDALEAVLRDAMTDMRQMSAGLFLPDLRGTSIGRTIDIAVVNHERRSKSRVATQFGAGLQVSAPMLALACIYRFVQEGLTNAHRHAGGAGQRVEAFVEDHEVTVIVCDEGPGLRAECCHGAALVGLGLIGMRDRLEALGGSLTIAANEPTGVRLTAFIDLRLCREDDPPSPLSRC